MAKRRIYWDTSVFLCFLNRNEETRRDICEDVLQHASMEQVQIYTSTFTIAEVIRPKRKSIPNAKPLTAAEVNIIRGMFRWPFITTIELDDRTATFASDLARDYGLAPADSVQAASAILWHVDVLHAWDRDFTPVSHLVNIGMPQFLSEQQSFDGMKPTRIGPAPDDFEAPPQNH